MDKFSYGQLINYIYDYDRLQRIAHGEDEPDHEARYRQLKSIEPLIEARFQSGEIEKEEYEEYRAALHEWEE